PVRVGGADGPAASHPRRGHHGAADRAPHERRHGYFRPRGGPRPRRQDRRGHARRGARQPAGYRGLSGQRGGGIMSALLKVEKMRAGYGPIEVLKGISLEVHEGEIVTIIGANGAGKTTTLLCLSGCNRVGSGGIHFQGRAIANLPPYLIVKRGLCQSPE